VRLRPDPSPLFLLVSLAVLAFPAAATAGGWARVGGGLAGMAMDDINNSDFRFYDDTINGYAFPDVGAGFLLDLALGNDLRPDLGFGFHWDRQWARVKGNDGGVDGTIGLNANAFMGRVQWRPLRGERWRLGLVAGLGPMFTDGFTEISRGTVYYGKTDLTGHTWAFDASLSWDLLVSARTRLQVWGGWRRAKIGDVRHGGAPVLKEDGSPLSLDYSGWLARAGLVFGFGD